ncbi:unnamed protein product [Brachionus calyciflorus]|uniref:Uncharacterized protein n=1 Tax=Brachionus calyciflorus TaxID=104777 RepID=A0A814ILA4_9BILA|nr:unnamed protein product [Brachionus calyciflorus]
MKRNAENDEIEGENKKLREETGNKATNHSSSTNISSGNSNVNEEKSTNLTQLKKTVKIDRRTKEYKDSHTQKIHDTEKNRKKKNNKKQTQDEIDNIRNEIIEPGIDLNEEEIKIEINRRLRMKKLEKKPEIIQERTFNLSRPKTPQLASTIIDDGQRDIGM